VKKNNEFVGIVTERDVLNKICSETINIMDLSVEKVMSSPLITIDAQEPIGKAAMIMESKNIRRLLVKKDGKIVGLITQKDILRETLNAFLAIQAVS
jgi:CBS domain-containing protein